ncbi:hypothetical protein GSI_04997 [Ganoderma sinense ZZ0214-1]|uniref:F-box domain-containing protein n=1 Tax=Ganoderma sinense ZZ0214-1 TaxID=1077348 RepID=A0A2G8SGI0_9APHY|nr:hypothetical protein GSI_04997 [Ganoderma sinense ZZ0214-1]
MFLSVKHLHLEDVSFRYFSDFAQIINSLRSLQSLVCYNVRWITLGVLPACMTQREGRAAAQTSLAPNLEELLIKSLRINGAERLVSALGSCLVKLCISIPYFDPSEGPLHAHTPTTTTELGIDLGHCSELEWLYIGANPTFLSYDGSSDLVSALLRSWRPKASVADPVVIFFMNDAQAFTRDAFVGVLRALGRIAEDWFRDVSGAENVPGVRQSVKVRVYDSEKWRGWWWDHVQACFPTWVRLKRLGVEFLMPRNEDEIWRDTV